MHAHAECAAWERPAECPEFAGWLFYTSPAMEPWHPRRRPRRRAFEQAEAAFARFASALLDVGKAVARAEQEIAAVAARWEDRRG